MFPRFCTTFGAAKRSIDHCKLRFARAAAETRALNYTSDADDRNLFCLQKVYHEEKQLVGHPRPSVISAKLNYFSLY